MTQYNSQESMLLAYVDGRLSEAESARVEKMLAADAGLRTQVACLRQAALPFKEAFDTELCEQIPQNTLDLIRGWQDLAAQVRPGISNSWHRYLGQVGVLIVGLLVGYSMATWSKYSADANAQSWLHQVASYHELYVRETVEAADFDLESRRRLRQAMRHALNADHPIPDLQTQALTFKRGQLLQIEGSPLVQIAYLPERGAPVVLCFTRQDSPNRDFRYGISHNLRYVNWSRDGVSYLLLGSLNFDQLRAAAINAARQL